jgi:hypothetical protein
MIAKSYIESNLKEIDRLYNNTTSLKKTNYYSKLAILELCGWIEITMDEIVLTYAKKKLKHVDNKKFVKERVKKNYGFDYNNNLKPLFYIIIGIVHYEKIEKKLERHGKITILKSTLDNLKTSRNNAAHTYSKGTTTTFDAPSLILNEYNKICPIILELAIEINAI